MGKCVVKLSYFFKKHINGYSPICKWLNVNNIHSFIIKYDEEYTRYIGIIGSQIPKIIIKFIYFKNY